MRKSMLAAIIAASALVPAAAFAQDDHHRDHGGGDGHAQSAPRQSQPRAQSQPSRAPRVEHPQFQPRPQQQVQVPQVRVQPQIQDEARGRDRQRDGGQLNGSDRFRGRQPQGQPGIDAARQQGQQGWRGNYRGNFPNGEPGRRADGADNRPQDFRASDRRGNNYNGGDWRENDRRSPGYGQQVDRYRGTRGNGGNWNRDWRQDRRYDWNHRRAQNRDLFHLPRYYAPHGWNYGYRRFSVGFRLSEFLFAENYWIGDPYYYDLPPAYGPYRWVRYYNDALLVDIDTGEVVDTVYDIFW